MISISDFSIKGRVSTLIKARNNKFRISSLYGGNGLLIITALGVTACGGGGGSASPTVTVPPIPTGRPVPTNGGGVYAYTQVGFYTIRDEFVDRMLFIEEGKEGNATDTFTITNNSTNVFDEIQFASGSTIDIGGGGLEYDTLTVTGGDGSLISSAGGVVNLSDTSFSYGGLEVIRGFDNFDGSGATGALTITGNRESNSLLGGSGADLIIGGSGDDLIIGGADPDILSGGAGNDRLLGGSGNDRLDGGFGDDILDGGSGNDEIDGGGGLDRLTGGSGNDEIDGGGGIDTAVYLGGGEFVITENTVIGADGSDTVSNIEIFEFANVGDDIVTIEGGSDFTIDIVGGGDDIIKFTVTGTYTVENFTDGDLIDLSLLPFIGPDFTVTDTLITADDLEIRGNNFLGNIILPSGLIFVEPDGLKMDVGKGGILRYTKAGSYTITDEATDKMLSISRVNDANEVVADTFSTTVGENVFDEIRFTGISTINIGIGAKEYDTLTVTGDGSTLASTAGGAVDLSEANGFAYAGLESIRGFSNFDGSGATGVLTITGNNGANVLTGGASADVITGGAGADTIDGGAGDDTIDGGAGADTIDGGAGADVAIYSGTGTFTITGESITGGDGSDTVSNVETFRFTDDGANIIDVSGTGHTIDISVAGGADVVKFTSTGTFTVQNFAMMGDTIDLSTLNIDPNDITVTDILIKGKVEGAEVLEIHGNNFIGNVTLPNVRDDETRETTEGDSGIYSGAGTLSYTTAGSYTIMDTAIDKMLTVSRDNGSGVETDTFRAESAGNVFKEITFISISTIDIGTGAKEYDTLTVTGDGSTLASTSGGAVDLSGSSFSNYAGLTKISGFDNFDGSGATGTLSVTGNAENNTLTGGSGADVITGGGGTDTIDGGGGIDVAVYSGGGAFTVTGDAVNAVVEAAGGDGSDTVSNIEIFRFTNAGADVINVVGTGYTLDISAGGVSDVLKFTMGTFTVQNFENGDRIDLSGLNIDPNDITVTDILITAAGLEIHGDNFGGNVIFPPASPNEERPTTKGDSGIYSGPGTLSYTTAGSYTIMDTAIDKMLTVSNSTNTDTFRAESAGNVFAEITFVSVSTINIGTGANDYDTLTVTGVGSTLESTASGAVDLGSNSAGYGGLDSITGFDNFDGSGATGTLTITGDAGVNVLTGGSGADTFTGGVGADTLTGGAGIDSAIYTGTGAFTITEDAAGVVNSVTGGVTDGTDTVSGIERFVFEDSGDNTINVDGGSGYTLDISTTGANSGADTLIFRTAGTFTVDDFIGGIDGVGDRLDLRELFLGENDVDVVATGLSATVNGETLRIFGNNFAGNIIFNSADFEGNRPVGKTVKTEPDGLLEYTDVGSYKIGDSAVDMRLIVSGLHGESNVETDTFTIDISGRNVFEEIRFASGSTIDIGVGGNEYDKLTVTGDGGTLASTSGGVVDLSGASFAYAGLDVIKGFDNFDGTGASDALTITGDAGVNVLTGGAGADTFTGGGGADTLTGGAGIDSVIYSGTGDFTITSDSVSGGDGSVAGTGSDTVTDIERFVFTDTGDNTINVSGTGHTLDIFGGGADIIKFSTTGTFTVQNFSETGDMIDLRPLSLGEADVMVTDTLITTKANSDLRIVGDNFIGNVIFSPNGFTADMPNDVDKEIGRGGVLSYTTAGTYSIMDTADDRTLSVSSATKTDTFKIADSETGNVFDEIRFVSVSEISIGIGGNDYDTLTVTGGGSTLKSTVGGVIDLSGNSANYAGLDVISGFDNFDGTGATGTLSVTGNVENNTLTGGMGNDTLTGGKGNDILTGGAGADSAIYTGVGNFTITETSVAGAAGGADGSDTVSNIEIFRFTNAGANVIDVTGGNNYTLDVSGAGSDTINFTTLGTFTVQNFETDDRLDLSSLTLTNLVIGDALITADGLRIEGVNFAGRVILTDLTRATTRGDSILFTGAGTLSYTEAGSYTITDEPVDSMLTVSRDNGSGVETDTFGRASREGAGDVFAGIIFASVSTIDIGAGGNDYKSLTVTGDGSTLASTASGSVDLSGNSANYAGLDVISGFANFDGSGASGTLTITGNDGANVLTGGSGADVIEGEMGADTIDGGGGIDVAVYSGGGNFTITETSVAGAAGGADGSDTVSNIETFKFTNAGANTINVSGDGHTLDISVGGGSDTINFTTLGTFTVQNFETDDRIDLSSLTLTNLVVGDALITADGLRIEGVNFAGRVILTDLTRATTRGDSILFTGAGTLSYTEAGSYTITDTVIDSMLTVSRDNGSGVETDTFGRAAREGAGDVFDGIIFASVSTIDIGAGGNDYKSLTVTGDGSTLASTASGSVDLSGNSANYAGLDVISGFANFDGSGATGTLSVTGNSESNVLTGGGFADILSGGAGGDTLIGGGANDVLTGGGGADVLSGGAGIDSAVYTGGGDFTIRGNSVAVTVVVGGDDDGTDMISGIERFEFTSIEANVIDVIGGTNYTIDISVNGGDDRIKFSTTGTFTVQNFETDDRIDLRPLSFAEINYTVTNTSITGKGAAMGLLIMGDNFIGNVIYPIPVRRVENFTQAGTYTIMDDTDDRNIEVEGNGATKTITITDANSDVIDELSFVSVSRIDIGAGANDYDTLTVSGDGSTLASTASGTVDLGNSAISYAGLTSISGFDNFDGSGATGTLSVTGNSESNVLTGGGFADILSGGAGADTLTGGKGNDILTGGDSGADIDSAIYSGAGNFTITETVTTGTFTVSGGDVDGSDTVSGIERFVFEDTGTNTFTVTGGTGHTLDISATGGDDRIKFSSAGTFTVQNFSVTGDIIDLRPFSLMETDYMVTNTSISSTTGTAMGLLITGNNFLGNIIFTAEDVTADKPVNENKEIAGNGLLKYNEAGSYTITDMSKDRMLSVSGADGTDTYTIADNVAGNVFDEILFVSVSTINIGSGGNDYDTLTVTGDGSTLVGEIGGSVDLSAVNGFAYAGLDFIKGFDNFYGKDSLDALTITGDAGVNVLTGGLEDDVLTGGAGDDILNGGSDESEEDVNTAVYLGTGTFTVTANSVAGVDGGVDGGATVDGSDTVSSIMRLEFTNTGANIIDVSGIRKYTIDISADGGDDRIVFTSTGTFTVQNFSETGDSIDLRSLSFVETDYTVSDTEITATGLKITGDNFLGDIIFTDDGVTTGTSDGRTGETALAGFFFDSEARLDFSSATSGAWELSTAGDLTYNVGADFRVIFADSVNSADRIDSILDFGSAFTDGKFALDEIDGNFVFGFANGDITLDKQDGAYNSDVNADGNISFDEFVDSIGLFNLGFS